MKKKNVKEEKKMKYTLPSNMRFILSQLWKCNKGLTSIVFLRSPFVVLASFLGLYLSKEVVASVTNNSLPLDIIRTVAYISLLLIIVVVLEKFMAAAIEKLMQLFDIHLQIELLDGFVKNDYEVNESPAGLTRISKAMESCGSDNRGARLISTTISSLVANFIGIISYAAILFSFNVWILVAVTATTLASLWVLKLSSDWDYKNKDKWKGHDRKIEYLLNNAGDFSRAKDIRLYGMAEWFSDVFDSTLSGRMKWVKAGQLYNFKTDWLRALLSLIRDVAAYGILVYVIFVNGMSGGDFVLYFGIVGGFAAWLSGIVNNFSDIHRFNLSFSEVREFLDYPNKANMGNGISLPTDTFSIEFKNVSFCYEGAENYTIKDLSFKLEKGEKLAIVGINGAGKTTLVKLMCGLYTPNDGEILIDGNPINAYNREDFYTLFSAVFQDIFVLPNSIADNIAADKYEAIDNERLENVIKLSGLSDKISDLPLGAQTRLVRSVFDEAVDLSGGEIQKLALARALYKDGKVLILDEPTAALDPIAESRIYQTYNEMTQGHTSVFISHRLASTRFCDRIFMFEGGSIIEEGTHDTLMQKNGKYFEMFETQSHYYKEEVLQNEF